MLEFGADVHALNEWGCGPQHFASLAKYSAKRRSSAEQSSSNTVSADGRPNAEQSSSNASSADANAAAQPETLSEEHSSVVVCRWLRERGLPFDAPQKEGHTVVHKAAQKRNEALLRYLQQELAADELSRACAPDLNGYQPSAIFRAAKGDESFAAWLEEQGM